MKYIFKFFVLVLINSAAHAIGEGAIVRNKNWSGAEGYRYYISTWWGLSREQAINEALSSCQHAENGECVFKGYYHGCVSIAENFRNGRVRTVWYSRGNHEIAARENAIDLCFERTSTGSCETRETKCIDWTAAGSF